MSHLSVGERRLLGLALAVLALDVLADALIAPEPGTGWREHVVSGGVRLAVVGIAAVIVSRARPGAVGLVAIVLGAWALVVCGIAVANLSDGRVRADVATGLLAGAAGLVLLAVGGRVLWRTRRRDGHVVARRAGIALVAVLAAAWLVLPVAIAIVVTHRPRGPLVAPPLEATSRAVTLTTADGLALRASYVPSRNGAVVVLLPDQAGTAAHARMLVRHGYGVLAVDMRGYGESEGDPNALGWGAARDVDAAVDHLASLPGVGRGVAALGLSVGGEVALEAAAGDTRLLAVVSDGAGERSLRESLSRGMGAALVLPLQAVQTAAVAALAGEAPPEALQELVGRIAPRPVLLIMAGRGGGGEDLNRTYVARAGRGTQLWEIPEAPHTGGIRERPAAYEQRVIGFLDRAFGISSSSASKPGASNALTP